MFYLNNQLKVLHRDLKLQNLFLHFKHMEGQEHLINDKWLAEQDLDSMEFEVKIGDFGFSK